MFLSARVVAFNLVLFVVATCDLKVDFYNIVEISIVTVCLSIVIFTSKSWMEKKCLRTTS